MAPVRIEPARRFTDKPALNPGAVRGLAPDHPAMVEGRTLFPNTVVEVTESEPARLLVSGANNRKLGDVVAKGRFKGYALYGLSLEERATCPSDCAVRDIYYGNGMQMARRHRIGDPDTFYDRLGEEIATLLSAHDGLLVRLHVLGDFPSVEYVANWADLLEEWETLAVYGYTARRKDSDIGEAIAHLKQRFPDRFRIRWSNSDAGDGAFVLDKMPDGPKFGDAIVCPTQTDMTACCSTCGLCWESDRQPIAFIKHGPKSDDAQIAAENAVASAPVSELQDDAGAPIRNIRGAVTIHVSKAQRAAVGQAPAIRLVDPADLRVEGAYQRDLSKKSIRLLRKIVTGWDWAKFKPPICAMRDHGLVVIDGQHTAIAAATLGITEMPVLVVDASAITKRAESFVSHNRDRIAMSPFQIFHASVVAGDPAARAIAEIATQTGAIIPRAMPLKNKAKPGCIIAINEILRYYNASGSEVVRRIFTIAVASQSAPLSRAATRGLEHLLTSELFAETSSLPDSRIANALRSLGDGFDAQVRLKALETDKPMMHTAADLIADACQLPVEQAA